MHYICTTLREMSFSYFGSLLLFVDDRSPFKDLVAPLCGNNDALNNINDDKQHNSHQCRVCCLDELGNHVTVCLQFGIRPGRKRRTQSPSSSSLFIILPFSSHNAMQATLPAAQMKRGWVLLQTLLQFIIDSF